MDTASESVAVRTPDGEMGAYLVHPVGSGPFPAVVVVMEAFGLTTHIKRVAERLAREGYVTLAPDLYYREGNPIVPYDDVSEAIRLMNGLWDDKVLQDMAAAIEFVQQQPLVRPGSIGMTGFCMGGRITFLTAARNPTVTAAAPFYGGGIGRVMAPSERTPRAPLEYAEGLRGPLLLFFGGNDPFIPLEEVERIKERLAALHKRAETIVYAGAPHGFFCEDRDSYRAEAAQDAWHRLLTFFQSHLGS
jgi:carboxymethylenebutenolidase